VPDAHDRLRNTALIFAARDGRLEIAEPPRGEP